MANRIRIKVYSWGTVKHPSGDFEVDRSFYRDAKRGFDALAAQGYYLPVLRQHKSDGKGKGPRPLEDGFQHGKVVDLEADSEGIHYVVEPTKRLFEAYQDGHVENWSPSFYPRGWKHPHTGEKLDRAPRHLAFVSIPHQKNLGKSSPYYSMAEAAPVELGELSTDALQSRIDALSPGLERNRLIAEKVRRMDAAEFAEDDGESEDKGTHRGVIIAKLTRQLRAKGYSGHALKHRRREALKLHDALTGQGEG